MFYSVHSSQLLFLLLDKNDGDFLVVWFPEEEAYSIVDRKSVLESKANVRDKVTVKDSKGKWKCRVVFKGDFYISIPLAKLLINFINTLCCFFHI